MYPIVRKEVLADQIVLMEVKAPMVARKCLPGQFIIAKTDEIGERPVNLYDTVTVTHPDLGVSDTAKVVEVQFNPYTEKNVQITIGRLKKTIVDTIADIIKK